MGIFDIFLNGQDEAHKLAKIEYMNQSPFGSSGLNLNPVGRGSDYICFPLLADIGFSVSWEATENPSRAL